MADTLDGQVKHQIKVSQLDHRDRELEITVDSTYSRLDELVDTILNDPDSIEALKANPNEFFGEYGISFSSEIDESEITVPDADTLRSMLSKDATQPVLQPGVKVSSRSATGLALIEVAVAVSLWVILR